MKKIATILILLISCSSLFAQMPGGAPGKMPAGQGMPNMGHVYGKITDSTGKPLSDVSVVLLQSRIDAATKKTKEVLLKGASTKGNGEFNWEMQLQCAHSAALCQAYRC